MRKVWALMLAAVMLAAGLALADETVRLPGSRYAVTLPDGMVYDGPTPYSEESFAYVAEGIGLEISFSRYENTGGNLTVLMMMLLEQGAEDISMTSVGDVEMLVFRFPPADESGMKGIGYVLQDGDATQKIVFWYATQEAADLTKTIMESIEETEPV